MKARVLAVACFALLMSGCPAGGFFGRYLVINNTNSIVSDLKVSIGAGAEHIWEQTLPGQGWIHSKAFGAKFLVVSWHDEAGYHEKKIDFAKKCSYRSKADLCIELKRQGEVAWRIIDPPTESGAPSAALAVMVGYILYLMAIIMLVGVPLAMAALTAYGLFHVARLTLLATVDGLHGDQSVFQFTIREVLMLTTMIALSLGWLFHYLATKQ